MKKSILFGTFHFTEGHQRDAQARAVVRVVLACASGEGDQSVSQ
jgi:hypothetical protein